MKNFIKSKYFTYILAAAFSIAFVAFFIFNPSHAFFQVHKDFTGVNTAKVDLLFDKFDASGDYGEISVDLGATWGTPKNPYVIDDTNHISNLSVLQKSGYFNSKNHQCFFVVCTPTGYPVAIDCDGMEIAPIGSPARPFTGSIQGAPLAVTDSKDENGDFVDPYDDTKFTNVYTVKYSETEKAFTVSQSAIADLKIVATERTPDIGFFGTLGYVGTVTEGGTTDTGLQSPSTFTGYAAYIDNLLFADITISDSQSVVGDWFTSHLFNGVNETHHVGIVAGHAEWATLKNISVYYTPDANATNAAKTKVPAFALTGDSTNYYSITGILGTLRYVNPPATETANTYTSQGAISDKDLSEELLSGGGGSGSGMLTGYMLAENIFDRNTNTGAISLLDGYAIAYDVKDMKAGEASIFTSVVMKERTWPVFQDWEDHTYYYFADTIFTFAMSAQENDPHGYVDYVVKIWDIDAENSPPVISLTASKDNWEIRDDPLRSQSLFKLTAVSANQLTAGQSYILLYKDGDNFYAFDIMSTEAGGFVKGFTPYVSPVDTFTDLNGNEKWDDAESLTKDYNNNGKWDDAEPFINLNGNEERDYVAEPFVDEEDENGQKNGVYDEGEEFDDINGNGIWDASVLEPFIDVDDNGEWQQYPDTYTDTNSNGKWDDAEPYEDLNKNGRYDEECPYFTTFDALGNISQMYLQNTNFSQTSAHSFVYDKATNVTFTSHDGSMRFGVTSSDWETLSHHSGTQSAKTSLGLGDLIGGLIGSSTPHLYWYDWAINASAVGETLTDSTNSNATHTSEPYTDTDGDGHWDAAEPFTDVDGDGNYDTAGWFNEAEPFEDLNDNGKWDVAEPLTDIDGDGVWDEDIYFIDTNGDGKWTADLSLGNTVTVTGNFSSSGGDRVYHSQTLYFDTTDHNFKVARASQERGYPSLTVPGETQFLLYKVELVEEATVEFKDYFVKENVTTQNFDLSQNVFFCDPYVLGDNEALDQSKLDRSYVLTPLLQKQWNNGKGQYLTSLNHAVKIANQTPENFQLTLSNTFIGDWFGDVFNTNEGGVVIAELGTTGINYAIPTGSIAFYINKASADDPSEINIIVAVNPNSGAQTISLWGPQALDSATASFSSAQPSQAFALPLSAAAGNTPQPENLVHVEGYYVADDTSDTGYSYVDEDRYTWLGGEVAFVGCTFEVTEPGVYLIGSSTGPMTVSYFSVTGAAGSGGDGTGGSPLGDIDFVYDNNNGTIITVDKKFEDAHILSGEDVATTYYPSYFYLRLLPKKDKTTIPQETLYVRRYVDTTTQKENLTRQRRRWLTYSCNDPDTSHLSLLDMYEDNVQKNGQTVSD